MYSEEKYDISRFKPQHTLNFSFRTVNTTIKEYTLKLKLKQIEGFEKKEYFRNQNLD